MFKIITADNKHCYQQELHEMFARRSQDELSIDSPVYDHQESVYIYFNDKKTGIYGSARLNPLTSKNLVCDNVKLDAQCHDMETAWECSTLSFEIEDNHPAYDSPELFDSYCTFYYKMLHETVIKVCRNLNIQLLFFLNTEDELQDMKNFGHMCFDHISVLDKDDNLALAVLNGAKRKNFFLI